MIKECAIAQLNVYSYQELGIEKIYNERVFSALTSSVEIPQFYPLKSVESTWTVGGEVLYKGEVEGAPFTDYGVIEQLESPSVYRYRYWSDNHGTQRMAENLRG